MSKSSVEVRVVVSCEDAEEESIVTKLIGAELLRLGVDSVSVIADNEHIHYRGGEVHNVTAQMQQIFSSDPRSTIGAYVVGDGIPK